MNWLAFVFFWVVFFWVGVLATDGITHHSCAANHTATTFFGQIACEVKK